MEAYVIAALAIGWVIHRSTQAARCRDLIAEAETSALELTESDDPETREAGHRLLGQCRDLKVQLISGGARSGPKSEYLRNPYIL